MANENEIELLDPNQVALTTAGESLIAEYNEKAVNLELIATEFKIKTDEDYSRAGEIFKNARELYETIEGKRKSITQKIDSWKDFVMGIFGKSKEITLGAKKIVGDKMLIYSNEKERLARIEEERIRKENEAKARELERRANEAKGKDKKAELKQKAEETRNIQPVIDRQTPKVGGVAKRVIWHGDVIPGQENSIERSLMTPDLVKIGQIIRAEKGTKKHPGIKIWCETVVGGSR